MVNLFQDIIITFTESPVFFLLTIALTSLCIGSFLNVVIYRLPVMMQNEWNHECKLLLSDDLKQPYEQGQATEFNLATPASTCPKCKSKIKAWQNIPVFSWLFLKGKCGSCDNSISIRYPSIELLTAIASVAIAHYFGPTALGLSYLIVTWCLVALIFIDIDHMLLPDQITLPLLWLALLASVLGFTMIEPAQAIIGAAVGYLCFWSVYWVFKLVTGKEGMGYGDFKLMAVFGALLGWQSLPMIILLSSLVGAVIGITLLSIQGKDKATPIPFGPYIAIAGWIAMIWGEQITSAYYQFALGH
ncbi:MULTISPECIES: A24 family peptidase [unclassified Pseudoalteromonas]|uniref:prepilin peptidase n=1 Tax=unclassified Pseudoalteromonas TaxID=194690 RepID=UPI0005AA2020|nr:MULTISPECIES: A24 family peptidase [unclassified Pseudoalteromonas]